MTYTQDVLSEVLEERIRQELKWGVQNWHVGGDRIFSLKERMAKLLCTEAAQDGVITWKHILEEEFWEVFANDDTDPQSQRAELIQVAAVAVAAIEAIDRRGRIAVPPQNLSTPICYNAPEAQDASGDGEGSQESPERKEASPAHEASDDPGPVCPAA